MNEGVKQGHFIVEKPFVCDLHVEVLYFKSKSSLGEGEGECQNNEGEGEGEGVDKMKVDIIRLDQKLPSGPEW